MHMPRGLQWVTSNRLEVLSSRLAASVRRPLGDPLTHETVVVQSLGMARWIQLELTRQNGVCSAIRFPFPQVFLREVCTLAVPDGKDDRRWDREPLTWRIWSALTATPGLSEAQHYAGTDPRRRFQLSARLAGLFDHYLVYRPDWVEAWSQGEDASWQALLWRAVGAGPDDWPESKRFVRAIERLEAGEVEGLPERVSVFGISALPPLYLKLLAALGTCVEVTLYQLQPCREYWGDVVSSRDEQRLLRKARRRADEAEALHLERGHRLLASLGRLGRSFLAQMAEQGAGADEADPEDSFVDPGSDSLLHAVQSDLLQLIDRSRSTDGWPRWTVSPDDASLRIHACHGPRRELEVLQDQLLAAFDADPTLAPRDILVLTPDIEAYAPLIQAVFGTPESEDVRLPFTVADRTPRAESALADAFLALLRLPGGRFGRSDVLPLLERPALQRRFGWAATDLPQLKDWLDELQVSWGLDAAQRSSTGIPALGTGTWRQAADRLLLGHALAPGDEVVMGDLCAFDAVEGDGAVLAGRLAQFVSCLAGLPSRLATPRPLPDWATELEAVLVEFFAVDPDSEGDFALIRECLHRLRQVGRDAAMNDPVPLEAVVEQLGPWLAEERRAGGFLRGGITFAALKPMRSVPARVIAVLGLNDGAFPRRPTPLSFDLIAAQPRPGDEARDADDRYLFLETLLSARDRLHLSYVGRSVRDNSDLPPSVVLSELIDHLAGGLEGGMTAVQQQVVVRHPLHAFSPQYFGGRGDGTLFSYSRENSVAARALRRPGQRPPDDGRFCPTPLPEPEGSWKTVSPDLLARFLANPSRIFLERRLQLQLPEAESSSDDREVFEVDALARFRIEKEWLDRERRQRPTAPLVDRLGRAGALPLGPAGRLESDALRADVDRLLGRLSAPEREILAPLPVRLNVGELGVEGALGERTAAGLRLIRPAKFKVAELLRLWVLQVVSAVAAAGPVPDARLITADECWTVSAPEAPEVVLHDLLELWVSGLRRPLPFFPRSAWAFTAPSGKASPHDRALAAWESSYRATGEGADPAFAFCFGAVEPHPFNDEFEALARRVCDPVRRAAREEGGK